MAEAPKKRRAPIITLDEPTKHNREAMKLLNATFLPVRYSDKFYDEAVRHAELNRLAYYNDILTGSICCRYEKTGTAVSVYIMSIGVLAPYRRMGIASRLLEHILKVAVEHSTMKVSRVYLHVWVENDEAIAFYKKKGFSVGDTVSDYYKKLTPPDGIVLFKDIL